MFRSLLGNDLRKDESDVVVVNLRVDEEGALKVYTSEAVEANGQARIAVHSLDDLSTFVVDDPVGIDLGVSLRIQDDRLVGTEIGGVDLGVVGAVVQEVWDFVIVKIVLTGIAHAITIRVLLIRIVDDGAVILLVADAIVIGVGIALVAHAVVVSVPLVAVGDQSAVVQRVLDTVPLQEAIRESIKGPLRKRK